MQLPHNYSIKGVEINAHLLSRWLIFRAVGLHTGVAIHITNTGKDHVYKYCMICMKVGFLEIVLHKKLGQNDVCEVDGYRINWLPTCLHQNRPDDSAFIVKCIYIIYGMNQIHILYII